MILNKLLASIVKETLIVIRDKAGLAIVFIMPMALLIIMTLLQDSSYKKISNSKTPILLVDNDKDSLGFAIKNGLINSGYFDVVEEIKGKKLTENEVNDFVSQGLYQLGIVIPDSSSIIIRNTVKRYVLVSMNQGLSAEKIYKETIKIKVFTDPLAIQSFKNSIISSIENFTTKIEMKIISTSLSEEINKRFPGNKNITFEGEKILNFEEIIASTEPDMIMPNSVQHNVPAWTIFAIFFIIIPLASHIIKERNDGSLNRILTMPVSYVTILFAKIIVYTIISLILVTFLFSIGYFVLPLMGMPELNIGNSFFAIVIVSLSTSLAACGYGVLIGSIATTHYQAASFGAISVIILAAIGGIWVPVYVMPDVMKSISTFSPLNWGINGYYDIFLRGYGVLSVFNNCLKLLGFFGISMIASWGYKKYVIANN